MNQRKLTDQELDICRQTGVSPEDYLATEAADLEAAACREDSQNLEETKKKIMQLMGISSQEAETRQARLLKRRKPKPR